MPKAATKSRPSRPPEKGGEEGEKETGSRIHCRGAFRSQAACKRGCARPPTKEGDSKQRTQRRDDETTCEEAAAVVEQKPLDSSQRAGSPKQGKPFLVCCCPLCFLCLLLSDDRQKLAFINAIYLKKRNRERNSSNCSWRTKKARQQQQRQHPDGCHPARSARAVALPTANLGGGLPARSATG